MKSKQSHYKKPKSIKKNIVATIKILVTTAVIAVTAIVMYYGFTDGWQAVADWFSSKYACLIAVIILVAGFLAMWIISLAKTMKKVQDNE